MKRALAVLLSICLVLSFTFPVMAAALQTSGAAKTLRLESTEGTVQLKNAAGKKLKLSEGIRLYNGYTLTTKKASYAYVSLDDTKAIKLDASTSSEVFQSGKKLELKVSSGQIFFNVTAPLKSDESLTIRTSTMVTGLRGTCGWVEAVDRNTSRVSLLEGKLTITSTDPLTNTLRTTTIVGGQTATIVYHGAAEDLASESIPEDETIQDLIDEGVIHDEHIIREETGLTVEALQEEDVPGSVAIEVKKDPVLQQKIDANSDLSVPEIIGTAEERIEAEEAQAEHKDQEIQEALENMGAEKTDPLFEEETAQDTGSAETPVVPEPEPEPILPEPEPVPPATTYDLEVIYIDTSTGNTFHSYVISAPEGQAYNVTAAEYDVFELDHAEGDPLSGSMDGNKTVIFYYNPKPINLTNPTADEIITALTTEYATTVNATYTANSALTSAAPIIVAPNQTLNINGSSGVANDAAITVNGTLNVDNEMENSGTITVNSEHSLHITSNGTLYNYGTVIIGQSVPGSMTVEGFLDNMGSIIVATDSTLNVPGNMNNSADNLTNVFEISGTASFSGYVTNGGSITVPAGGSMLISGIFDNDPLGTTGNAVITVHGNLTLETGGTLNNDAMGSGNAALNVYGTFTTESNSNFISNYEFTNAGTFINNGQFIHGGEFNNTGTILSTGPISNDGGYFTILEGSCTVDNFNNAYGTLLVEESGTLTVTGTILEGFDPDLPMVNPTVATVYGTVIIEENCQPVTNPCYFSNYGTCINRSANLSPTDIGFTNVDDGQYIDATNLSELHMMVTNSNGKVIAWGIMPTPWYVGPSVFADPDTGVESWISGYTYTIYGPQPGTLDAYGNPLVPPEVSMPDVSASNVTLDLNGNAVTLLSTLKLQGGSLTIRDSGTNGELTSEAEYTIEVNGGDLVLHSGTVSNTVNSVLTGSIGTSPASTITINGGSVVGKKYGIYTGIPVDPTVTPVTITVKGTDYTENIAEGGGTFPVSGETRAIEHTYS